MTQPRTRDRRTGLVAALGAVLLAAPAFAAPAVAAPSSGNAWTADLSVVDADDVNVQWTRAGLQLADTTHRPASQRATTAEGMLLFAPHTLATPANRVRADLAAHATPGGTVEVEARGWRADSSWTEWRAADQGAIFDQPVSQVQVRLVLTATDAKAAPTANSVRLTADSVVSTYAATPGLTYRIYATREGLVGGTTANGHVITSNDHFVALPSRRGLSAANAGDYTVKVCTTTNSRCEYAPVWDVGPWNTKDDYWNPSSTREMWTNLPQGTPEAQAAYQSGYNGGKDQFGRTVANPAGIDLADGVFWDGLLLSDNSWVNVSYLWTGTGSRGTVGGGPLNIRSGPGTSYASKGYAAKYARVPIECYTTGTSVTGTYGTTTRWDRLASGEYVSHAYIGNVSGTVAAC